MDVMNYCIMQEGMTLKARALHSVTAFSLAPGLIEVIIFGGSSKNYSGNDAKQAKVAETTLLTFSKSPIYVPNLSLQAAVIIHTLLIIILHFHRDCQGLIHIIMQSR